MLCIFMHGSSGFGRQALEYMRMMARKGYLVLAPDHIEAHHKNRKKIAYTSSYKLACTGRMQKVYRYVVGYRLCELESCIRFAKMCFPKAKLVTVGTSEGAIAVAKSTQRVDTKLIFSYVLRGSYFEPHDIFHSQKGTHVVNVYGENDEFFGSKGSISSDTHTMCGGKHWTDGTKPNVKTVVLRNTGHNIMETATNRAVVEAIIKST